MSSSPKLVGPPHEEFIELRLAGEIRLVKVRPAEGRPSEVRTNVGVLFTPLIPGGHALLEQRDMLVISHWIIQGREAVRSTTIATAVGQRLTPS